MVKQILLAEGGEADILQHPAGDLDLFGGIGEARRGEKVRAGDEATAGV